MVALERNLCGNPLAVLREGQFEEVLLGLEWREVPNWECLLVHRKLGLSLSENVDDVEIAGKKQNEADMWKKLMKNVDLDEPTSSLDPENLGCTQRECKPRGRMTWKDMPENVLSGIANWRTKRQSS